MKIISSFCSQHEPEVSDINGAYTLEGVVIFHLEIFSSRALHLSIADLSLQFVTVECNFHTKQWQAIRLPALWNLFLVWWVTNLPVASSIITIQIISVTFSFSWLFAKLTSTHFQHHKKLLQAHIHVCKPKCKSRGCRKQEILHIFKSHRFLVLCLVSAWDVCEGRVWRT